jgi:hypothetical protein
LASASSRVSPFHSFEKAMARCLISFHERGMAAHCATAGKRNTSAMRRGACNSVQPRQRASEARSMFLPRPGARGRAGERPCTIRSASIASLSTPEARGWRYGRSGTMAADSRRRARMAGKLEREGFARRRERGEGVAVAGRGAGERSEAGRGDTARSA